MRNYFKISILPMAVVGASFFLGPLGVGNSFAQQQPADAQQPAPGDDPIRQLYLTAEQREKIRAIREQTKEERAAINQRLGESNRALEEALDSDNPDEALVEQRLRDVGAAQTAQMRMRVLTEVRIRRVLTPEQRLRWRQLLQQARRERQLDNVNGRRNGVERRRQSPNQGNSLDPILPNRRRPLN